MIEIRKVLKSYLKTLHPDVVVDGKNKSRVFFQEAPEDAIFPYIVYDLPSIFSDGEGGETITLEIDGWDCNNTWDTTVIENLMQTINALDKKVLTADTLSVVFFLENKFSVLDDDKRIKRRKYTYSGKLFRRDE